MTKMKKTIAILLTVLFLATVTAGAVSADKNYKLIPKMPMHTILGSSALNTITYSPQNYATTFATTTEPSFKKAKITIEK
jgi:hypothetical protein